MSERDRLFRELWPLILGRADCHHLGSRLPPCAAMALRLELLQLLERYEVARR